MDHPLAFRSTHVAKASLALLALGAMAAPLALGAAPTPEQIAAHKAAQKGKEQPKQDKPEFPPFEEVSKDYVKVVSTADGQRSLYTIWTRDKDAQMLAELPPNFQQQRIFIATTIAGGDPFAGIQFGDMYVYWKRYDKRLALIEPNVAVRSTGDDESKSSLKTIFTDRVILDVPILTMGPGGGPVIDMDNLLVKQAPKFFGGFAAHMNTNLINIADAKAFPNNIELAYQLPTRGGTLATLHYSFSVIPDNPGYKPRKADARIGFFTTAFRDIGKPDVAKPWTRYINRWDIQKADPSLKLSPPRNPIVFYIEHTTPVRYRRWVRDGLLEWNKAFEEIGIVNAVEVYQQDANTGAHMDKDPEDVRYNFIRWTTADTGFAIGPSRADPRTGQILDADIVIPAQFVRGWSRTYHQLLPQVATEGFSPETLAWLDKHPSWDPRLLLVAPAERERLLQQRRQLMAQGISRNAGGHPAANIDATLMGDDLYDGLSGRISQLNGACASAQYMGLDIALFRLGSSLLIDLAHDDADGDEDEGDMLDGVPEWFIGPLLKDLVMHESGHTLGLRHNFKASTAYSLKTINNDDFKGAANIGSVMDYNPVNINVEDGPDQGDYTTPTIGPYDHWAIHYGYTSEEDLTPILSRVAEPELAYATDEDTWGPDPRARRGDLGADPLKYAQSRMRLVQLLRSRLMDRVVEDGDSWAKATDAYNLLLGMHIGAVSTAANWIGGSFVNRDKKGDPAGRDPIADIPASTQRHALQFVIDNAFYDSAFGLTPALLRGMSVDKWWDQGGVSDIFTDETWSVHDRIAGIQAATMTMVLNPTTLRRVYDNEFRIPGDQDALTLPELIDAINDSIWAELDQRVDRHFTARQPMISSLRRDLQRALLERTIELTMPGSGLGAAARPVSNLCLSNLRELQGKMKRLLESADSKIDPYTLAHLTEASIRIDKALDAQYIYNTDDIGGGGSMTIIFNGDQHTPAKH